MIQRLSISTTSYNLTPVLAGFLIIAVALVCILFAPSASAASLHNWRAGNIIEDAVFTNSGTMDTASIQSFLNSKVPVCDTYGTQASEFGGGTRAQWAAARGYSPPFTCLKDFSENGKTAAQIIYDASQEFSINPQVLIVLLQKEQGLITDTWPIPGSAQYRSATGYGCPDTAACDSQYYGLTNQVRWAARMYRAIMNASPTWYTPYMVGSNYIRYNPDANCGGSTVYIENRATQALYNYTPYQPNAGALAAGWGTAYCGAYGNRNFYHYFVDWFGSTRAVNGSIVLASNLTVDKPLTNIVQNDIITASFKVENKSTSTVNVGGLGICARLNGQWYDFGFIHNNSLAANSEKTISFSKRIASSGNLELFTCSYNDALGGWANGSYPYNGTGTVRRLLATVKPSPLLNSSVSISQGPLYAGTDVGASFTIQNTSNQAVNIGRMVLAVRDSKGNNYDFPSENAIIPAGGTYIFNQLQSFRDAGEYTYFLTNRSSDGNWDTSYPSSASSGIARKGSFSILKNPQITSSINFSPASPQVGDPVTVSITIKNNSSSSAAFSGRPVVTVRSSTNKNYDFPSSNVSIPAGSSVTYSQTRTFDEAGEYKYGLNNNHNGAWVGSYPDKASSGISTNGVLRISPEVSITSFDLSKSNITPSAGRINASITIRNSSSVPINVGRIVFVTRDTSGANFDLPSSGETVVPANSSVTVSSFRDVPPGRYSIQTVSRKDGVWDFHSPPTLPGISRSGSLSFE